MNKLELTRSNRQYKLKDIYNFAKTTGNIKSDITYREFADIVYEFNKKVSDKIITQNYKFDFGFGSISVVRYPRKGKSINWFESKKVRQDIIDRGEIPFNKKEAPDGIKWFVYFDSKDYFKWTWFKKIGTQFIKNIKYYVFQPMTDNKKRVGKVVNNDPFADLKYGIYK